jgi:hypothetical protein
MEGYWYGYGHTYVHVYIHTYIQVVGEYLVEVWKATGMDMERVKFVWSSDDITNKVNGKNVV